MVLGWLGSAPPMMVSRPVSSAAESHERPAARQDGACRMLSKVAVLTAVGFGQESNLKAPTCVRQRFTGALIGLYMPVNQNVQSSTGSTLMAA